MSFGYVVRPLADQDIDEIGEDHRVEEAGLETGLDFLTEIHETVALLASQRDFGWPCRVRHPGHEDARTLRVSTRFEKHLVFYQPFDDRIEVLRVLHGAQDLIGVFDREGVDLSLY